MSRWTNAPRRITRLVRECERRRWPKTFTNLRNLMKAGY